MKTKGKPAVLIAGTVMLLMGLFPPWVEFTANRATYLERPAGRAFLFSAPKPMQLTSIEVDTGRLLVGWTVVALALGLWVAFGPSGEVPQTSREEVRDVNGRLPAPDPRRPESAVIPVVQGVVCDADISVESSSASAPEHLLVACRSCGQKLRVLESAKVVRCPRCRTSMRV